MYVLRKGTLTVNHSEKAIHKLVMASSQNVVWNADMILNLPALRLHFTARTVTFVELEFLDRCDMVALLDAYPFDRKTVRTRTRWLAVFRMVDFMIRHGMMTPQEVDAKKAAKAAAMATMAITTSILGGGDASTPMLAMPTPVQNSRHNSNKLSPLPSNYQVQEAQTAATATTAARVSTDVPVSDGTINTGARISGNDLAVVVDLLERRFGQLEGKMQEMVDSAVERALQPRADEKKAESNRLLRSLEFGGAGRAGYFEK
jgi:hypothetical protein